ncbi:response regulator [Opitutus terrae]|uniref:Two component transcriptional regulator, LuxR family n=1 Tax=Opitutus terrae (strain DSM 11246 / JCM 15787 / PB90-1) TaxID=452637 RepID=B1ZVM0_OPITP|nr:response regulator transcription factor [Opitutus terrae]ACB74117.1 two component transcriptional regulator, LuxR family [Opitutus terrae PB90-1]
MPAPLKIVLADDHALVRAGIRTLLEKLPGVTIVGEAGDGRETVTLVHTFAPDIAIMDITMPGLNGFDATARIAREHPRTKVLILSMHTAEDYVLQALRAGATGYLLKDAATAELQLALNAVRKGETYLSPSISKSVLARFRQQEQDPRAEPTKALTPRMREIVQLIAEGRSTKEIAFLLNLSVKTIETHRMHLMARLGLHDVAGVVRYALRTGLISADH